MIRIRFFSLFAWLLFMAVSARVWAADENNKDRESLGFYGLPVVETNTVFLLDFSSSMRGERIKRLRQEFTSVLEGMSDRRRFGIILFCGLGTPRFPIKGLASADAKRKKAALKFIKRPPNGKTPMLSAFDSAFFRLVRKDAKPEQRVDAYTCKAMVRLRTLNPKHCSPRSIDSTARPVSLFTPSVSVRSRRHWPSSLVGIPENTKRSKPNPRPSCPRAD